MYAEERQQAIAQLVVTRGRVSVTDLAEEFAVTTETVRRDLSALDRLRLVRRVHGGAVPAASLSAMESRLDERDVTRAREKERIALAATRFLPDDGGTIAIDAGTTTARLAGLIPPERRLTAFTHGVPIAAALAARATIDLHLLPGRVRSTTQAAVGSITTQTLERVRVDVAFIGTNGITAEHGFSTPDSEEAAVKEALVRAARRVVVLADSTKVGRDTTVSFAELGDVDVLVTDCEPEAVPLATFAAHGVEVVLA
ncbi:DeoR/GlpR family DNA-binding transcription regulator [Georgenia sp. H159]|uniref:DeoR/GlpR family DNA-binding transcription regulator n=1 Tax=Georgenia sp. H159 TaxID=3076115 RepID=UPI002D76AC5C|nr:DeoR/GlpR family DNA-binding transcription regulator [Georgenia sp. H159]